MLESETGRLDLVALVGVQDAEGVGRRRGDARGAGRRRRGGRGLGRVTVAVQGLARSGRPRHVLAERLPRVPVDPEQAAYLVPEPVVVRVVRMGRVDGGSAATAADRRVSATAARGTSTSDTRPRAATASSGTSEASTATASATAWKREEPRAWRVAEWARVRARVSCRSSSAPARAEPTVSAPAEPRGAGSSGDPDSRCSASISRASRAAYACSSASVEDSHTSSVRSPSAQEDSVTTRKVARDPLMRRAAPQAARRVVSVGGVGPARRAFTVQAQCAQESGGLRTQVRAEHGTRVRRRRNRVMVWLSHAGASGRL